MRAASSIEDEGFVGEQLAVLDDGTWYVEVDGESPDLTKAVFRRSAPLNVPPNEANYVAPHEQENPDVRDVDGGWKDD